MYASAMCRGASRATRSSRASASHSAAAGSAIIVLAAAAPSSSRRAGGNTRLTTSARIGIENSRSLLLKNSASANGAGSRVVTTVKAVRYDRSSEYTSAARFCTPPYSLWMSATKLARSSSRSAPSSRSAIRRNGAAAKFIARHPNSEGRASHDNSRPPTKSLKRVGASRKSRALRDGGVSTTRQSYSPAWCSS